MKVYVLTVKNKNTGEQVIVTTSRSRYAVFGSIGRAKAYRTSCGRPDWNITEFTPGGIVG